MSDRVPAIPLIVNDPYFSVWLPGDDFTAAGTVHWTGAEKGVSGALRIDGTEYHWLGTRRRPMKSVDTRVTPTASTGVLEAAGVRLTATFWSPMLPEDPDALSIPITFVDYRAESVDGRAHEVTFSLNVSAQLTYDGTNTPPLRSADLSDGTLSMAYVGQRHQRLLGHSGDHITMDWGYLYMAARRGVTIRPDNRYHSLIYTVDGKAETGSAFEGFVMVGYDEDASINYFGALCPAWGLRNGKTLAQAMHEFADRHDEFRAACEKLDEKLLAMAEKTAGKDYARIISAAWRHTFAAHKLIATPEGKMALLSKENDSNGCIATVDVSYPSTPIFLLFAPEMVNALCRPVLEFASMPVWADMDFAPHDVGRYPYATGQVYAAHDRAENGAVNPPYYLYPQGADVYNPRGQMPVEECGNMLIMMEAAVAFGASDELLQRYRGLLAKWVRYLDEYGEDPGEQLCTDDFAGHLAHNVNLSAKAVVGVACYARILRRLGEKEEAAGWEKRAKEMADSWLKRAAVGEYTSLTFDGQGWSMKYNLVWDRVLGLNLLPEEFYAREVKSYLPRVNAYGLPLDSRSDYTKSDWLCWCAAMAKDRDTKEKLLAPLAAYLRETPNRVPFSDWYDTVTGRYVAFIARSVQGGVFMPMLAEAAEEKRR